MDIIFLQECAIPELSKDKKLQEKWNCGPSIWSGCNSDRNAGLGVLFRNADFSIQKVQHVVKGRLLCVDGLWFGREIRLINVYCPTSLSYRDNVLSFLPQLLLCNRNVFLGGD